MKKLQSLVPLAITLIFCSAGGTPMEGQHHNSHDARALLLDPQTETQPFAPILAGLGEHHHPITARSAQAQLFFDQGLKLTYGFNHQEALRSFKEAARLDPECAMAYWGWALVLGPNLNLPMDPELIPQALEAINKAMALRHGVSERERGFIEALAERYSVEPGVEQSSSDRAYGLAMERLHHKYPTDTDAATLYAAALMNLAPWVYWTPDGRPAGRTEEILAVLEGVIARDGHHEGALHYYIHAVESVDPERGEAAADALAGLAPGAGHLQHMPSHIYMQLGRYREAFEANVLAAEADESYLTQCHAQGIYPLNYYPHNLHFRAWAATLQGRSEAALEASRKVAAQVPADHHGNDWGLYQSFLSMPLQTLARFGRWDDILTVAPPSHDLFFFHGMWRYAHGLAMAHDGDLEVAESDLVALREIAEDPATEAELVGFSNASKLLTIATEVLAGEIAAAKGDHLAGISRLERAVRLEDSLLYNEPPDWYVPVRHNLGAVLLEAGFPEEAETVYWQDLRKRRDNGYALFGLARSLRAQGRNQEAREVEARFDQAWSDADHQLSSSRY